jgi:hypothetical protein
VCQLKKELVYIFVLNKSKLAETKTYLTLNYVFYDSLTCSRYFFGISSLNFFSRPSK